MTDRLQGVYVAFDQDVREDDAKALISAIELLQGVCCVRADVRDPTAFVARERARNELREQIAALLWPAETSD